MGTFFPYHYITYGNRHAFWSIICENGSIMKSLAVVDFFIENKGTFFPYHYITYGNRHALVRICENRSIMKSMAMVDFFIEYKGTFFPYHYITYGSGTRFGRIYAKIDSIMKSMAMVDFFIVNKAKLQLKQQDIINHTKVGKCINVCVNKNFLEYHYITYGNRTTILVRNFLPISLHYLWKQTALVLIAKMDSIMKSMAMVDFFIVNKAKLQLKQQDIINHTKVGKCINVCVNKNFLRISLHYLWKQTRFRPYLRKWVNNEIHG
ncbi:hypothetical protein H6P81_021562 [Aristolochia fimbriata]|uniref:LAGLIDADG homing endonuclease n=1 Tax=Aristolochia fimbriata TaxID=158543 RepID=A0AAV7DQL0_ARIFI|nr:hypothetical protein H6P81_021562 [Aristolochia fimbriata]